MLIDEYLSKNKASPLAVIIFDMHGITFVYIFWLPMSYEFEIGTYF